MVKKFLLVCIGIFLLACSYAIGASRSEAQVGAGNSVVQAVMFPGATNVTAVFTSNGDIYAREGSLSGPAAGVVLWSHPEANNWQYMGNCFTNAVPSQPNSLGNVKSLFR